MKKILYLLLLPFVLLSCDNEGGESIVKSASADFYVEDNQGNDLLNPENENAIDTTKIKVYYLINGKKVAASEYYAPSNQNGAILTYSKGFFIYGEIIENPSKYAMRIFLNDTPKYGELAYTYIEWNEQDTDTIVSKITRKGNHYLTSRMVTFNGSVMDVEKDGSIYRVIVK